MALNKNNFLRWSGAFEETPHEVLAVDDTVTTVQNAEKVELQPLLNDSATFGVDVASLVITQQDYPARPAVYNTVSGVLTYFIPPGASTGIRTLKYRFRDVVGNLSNEASINVVLTARVTGWRGLASTYYCVKDDVNDNTGKAGYTQLEKYYLDSGAAVVPAEVKPNAPADPDYIAPATDYSACPISMATLSVILIPPAGSNVNLRISRVKLHKPGDPSTVYYDFTTPAYGGLTQHQIKIGDYGMHVEIRDLWTGTVSAAYLRLASVDTDGTESTSCQQLTNPGSDPQIVDYALYYARRVNANTYLQISDLPC